MIMKRFLLTLAMIVYAVQIVVAQDVIVTRQAERIDAKVLEVSETEIKYKKTSNPDGPTFVLSTEKIASILYANGEVQGLSSNSPRQRRRSHRCQCPTGKLKTVWCCFAMGKTL